MNLMETQVATRGPQHVTAPWPDLSKHEGVFVGNSNAKSYDFCTEGVDNKSSKSERYHLYVLSYTIDIAEFFAISVRCN